MAIYSLNHAPIGKSTQARRYTAAAHVRYITRPRACTRLMGDRMPVHSRKARTWLRQQEDADRKNARVGDKVLIALPKELSPDQRADLVRGFAEEVTRGRASWLAAFHDAGPDRKNPHVHLFVRDRDPETGKRVCGMSDRGSTEKLRELWERHANRALQKAGRSERIDRRTLAAQGIRRAPTIHEGLSARDMQARGLPTRSRPVNYRNAPGAKSRERVVDYRRFDRGRSRPAYNRQVRETQADYWAGIDAADIVRGWRREEESGKALEQREAGMARKDEPGFFAKLGKRIDGAGKAVDDYLTDKSRPVKRGKDAPKALETRTGPDDTTVTRSMTAREQQQMSLPEAIYKKTIAPRLRESFQPASASPDKEQERSSFSERLASQGNAEKSQGPAEKARRERWKEQRERLKRR